MKILTNIYYLFYINIFGFPTFLLFLLLYPPSIYLIVRFDIDNKIYKITDNISVFNACISGFIMQINLMKCLSLF